MKLFSRTKHSGRSGQGMQQIPQETILELRQTFTGKWTDNDGVRKYRWSDSIDKFWMRH